MANEHSPDIEKMKFDDDRLTLEHARILLEEKTASKNYIISLLKIFVLAVFLWSVVISASYFADKTIELERDKLILMEQQFKVQKEQTSRSLGHTAIGSWIEKFRNDTKFTCIGDDHF